MSTNTRGKDIAEALGHLVDAREILAKIDLRTCNNELRGQLKSAQEGIHSGVSSLEDGLREHLRQEARKATS